MAVSLRKSEHYQVVISIWGVTYTSLPMTISQCEQAEKQAKEAYPGINTDIKEVVAIPKIQTLGEMEAANPDVFKTPDATTVRIKLNYNNHDLATIMRKLKEELRDGLEMYIKVVEDTPIKWAIETAEQYYYTVFNAVQAVTGQAFKAASTKNPDWDVFCSA